MVKHTKLMFIVLIVGVIFVAGCGTKSDPKLDALANCLADKSVKEYGAFWCPNCAKQEKMFGSAYSIIKDREVYIECDPRCDVPQDKLPIACRGMLGQTKLCLDKNVNKYPDWEFADGSRLVGVQDLAVLAEKAGCTFQ